MPASLLFLYSQKESLSEYGSGWGWDSDYLHAFDQTDENGIPYGYIGDDNSTLSICSRIDYTGGQVLYSLSQMKSQLSCAPDIHSGGNYYNWKASTADHARSGGITASNSVCPRGWQLPNGITGDSRSYDNFFRLTYGLIEGTSGAIIRKMPLSFLASGIYDSSLIDRREWQYQSATPAQGDKRFALGAFSHYGGLYYNKYDNGRGGVYVLQGSSLRCGEKVTYSHNGPTCRSSCSCCSDG